MNKLLEFLGGKQCSTSGFCPGTRNVESDLTDCSFKSVFNRYPNLPSEERKAAVQRIPEQIILTEVRRMVEDMQAMNKKLEETEAAINEYFKPLDKEAEIIMKTQLDGEKTMREMMKAMQAQALLEKAEADRIATAKSAEVDRIVTAKIAEANRHIQGKPSASTNQAEVRSST